MRTSNKRTILWLAAGAAALVAAGQAPAAHAKRGTAPRVAAPAAQPVGPRYAVSLWWNHGSDGGALQSAMQKCDAKLGPAHATVFGSFPQTTIVTGQMLQCLESAGWRPMIPPQAS